MLRAMSGPSDFLCYDAAVSQPTREESTNFLNMLGADQPATADMMSSLYVQMRSIADRLMQDERADHTLQPTALVHEAFLRLVDSQNLGSQGRLHFLGAAAVTMRRVLVDHARRSLADKRGGGAARVELTGLEQDGQVEEINLIALEAVLEDLERLDARQAKIVELRFFGGMSGQEIAEHLGISRNTVVRELTLSRAWLRKELGGYDSSSQSEG
jgi:RNA polymerase sigma-70 factor (ECF subfamily)